MSDLIIKPVDSVHIYVECEESLAKELNEYFTFLVPNYQFTPAYKKRNGMDKFDCSTFTVVEYILVY